MLVGACTCESVAFVFVEDFTVVLSVRREIIGGVYLWCGRGLVTLQRKLLMSAMCKRGLGAKLMIMKMNAAR